MSHTYLYLLLVGLCGFAHCHHSLERRQEPSKIVPGNTGFAFSLYHQIASENADKNIIFSPLTISTAFAMVMLGVRTTTLSQLLSGLGFNQAEISEQEIHEGFRHVIQMLNHPEGEIQLSIGNALFTSGQVALLEKFLEDAKNFYDTEALPTDFQNSAEAVNQINSYIEKKTDGKLVNVYKNPDPLVVMVLVSYVFMKASWENPFNPERTKENDFFVDEQTTVQVPMMTKKSTFETYHDEDLSCHVVKLPYKGGASALFILPDQGKMKELEDALNKDVLLKWITSMQSKTIDLTLPKFSITGSYVLNEILQKIGITEVFTNNADFSGMSEMKVEISKAVHEAILNVHEAGTEAAAATVADIIPRSLSPKMLFSSPFLLLIYHDTTSSILFMARVANPQQN